MYAIYEKTINKNELDDNFDSAYAAETYRPDSYAKRAAKTVFDNLDTIDAAIESKLNKRVLSRVPPLSLAIMRLSCAEMMFFDDVPNNISINEAVVLAKKYCESDCSYINGILGAVYKDISGAEAVIEEEFSGDDAVVEPETASQSIQQESDPCGGRPVLEQPLEPLDANKEETAEEPKEAGE